MLHVFPCKGEVQAGRNTELKVRPWCIEMSAQPAMCGSKHKWLNTLLGQGQSCPPPTPAFCAQFLTLDTRGFALCDISALFLIQEL